MYRHIGPNFLKKLDCLIAMGKKIMRTKWSSLQKMSKDSNEKINKTLSKKVFFGVNLVHHITLMEKIMTFMKRSSLQQTLD